MRPRIDAALQYLLATQSPDVIGHGETTATAAEELQSRILPGYELIFPDTAPESSFQVAVFYRIGSRFHARQPLLALDVPRTTRGMVVVDSVISGHCVRFVFVTGPLSAENSELYRGRLAEALSAHAYEFLNNTSGDVPHLVVLGDLNAEPFDGIFQGQMNAARDRDRARQRAHASDRYVRRVSILQRELAVAWGAARARRRGLTTVGRDVLQCR